MRVRYTVVLDPLVAVAPFVAEAVQDREPWGRSKWYGQVKDARGRVVAETDYAPRGEAERAAEEVRRALVGC